MPVSRIGKEQMTSVIWTTALGLPIAAAGAIGYIATGLSKDHLPPLSVGYVYLPALIGLVLGTFVTVPAGARAAHSIPVAATKSSCKVTHHPVPMHAHSSKAVSRLSASMASGKNSRRHRTACRVTRIRV